MSIKCNEPWHGTTGGYGNHGCRCAQCRDVWRIACKKYKAGRIARGQCLGCPNQAKQGSPYCARCRRKETGSANRRNGAVAVRCVGCGAVATKAESRVQGWTRPHGLDAFCATCRHGRFSEYTRGCRCAACTSAANQHGMRYQRRRSADGACRRCGALATCGPLGGETRCDTCRAKAALWMRERARALGA